VAIRGCVKAAGEESALWGLGELRDEDGRWGLGLMRDSRAGR